MKSTSTPNKKFVGRAKRFSLGAGVNRDRAGLRCDIRLEYYIRAVNNNKVADVKKDTSKTGRLGEDIACEYLIKKGYKVLLRNYREKFGEIDVIAKAKDRTLVFVEVKAFKNWDASRDALMPEDNLTSAKLKKLKRICELFVAKHSDLIDEKRGWRIDLLAIEIENNLAGDQESETKIRHYENIWNSPVMSLVAQII